MKYILVIPLFFAVVFQGWAFDFRWEIDETPEGAERATVVEPVEVVILDEVVDVPSHSVSLALMRKYSVHLRKCGKKKTRKRVRVSCLCGADIRRVFGNANCYEAQVSPRFSVWEL